MLVEKIFGEDELEDGVAEEFEALVVKVMPLGLVPETGVRERFREEEGIPELVFDALFERIHEGLGVIVCIRGAPRANFKSRALTGRSLRGIAGASFARCPSEGLRMPPLSHESTPSHAKNPWPVVVTILGVVALLLLATLWMVKKLTDLPGATLGRSTELVKTVGHEARQVAESFRKGTVRQEFFSHAAELSGTGRLQVATLKQRETFLREEAGSTAWGLIPVPKVVVQAQAPVEYTYYVDFKELWEFRQHEKLITVIPPPLTPNTPALDVSALTFYTLEGSIWRDAGPVRERLRETFTSSLAKRARINAPLVREVSRREIAEFVEKWLAEKFGDARDYRVKVIFPEEQAAPMPEKTSAISGH